MAEQLPLLTKLKGLDLSGNKEIGEDADADKKLLAALPPTIESLNLSGTGIRGAVLAEALPVMANLRQLNLSVKIEDCPEEFTKFVAALPPSIETLTLSSNGISDEGVPRSSTYTPISV